MITKEWRIRFHPAFELILDELTAVVAKERERDPANYKKSPQTRLLAALYRAITDEIPANVQHAEYYQGEAEGYSYSQWKRAKPSQHHRLFFKGVEGENLIIYAWLNSETSLAKYKSHLDAYRAFRRSQLQRKS